VGPLSGRFGALQLAVVAAGASVHAQSDVPLTATSVTLHRYADGGTFLAALYGDLLARPPDAASATAPALTPPATRNWRRESRRPACWCRTD